MFLFCFCYCCILRWYLNGIESTCVCLHLFYEYNQEFSTEKKRNAQFKLIDHRSDSFLFLFISF